MKYHDADILDRHAYEDSIAHRMDPRAKLLATLVYIVTVVSFNKYAVAPLAPFVIFPMAMAILGYVPFSLILKRLAIASPFIVFIGIFNPILDRTMLISPWGFEISGGWVSFASILLRGLLCISAAIVLIATTSFPRIAEASRALGAPRAMVVQLMLLYRYLFLLVGEARRMSRAKALRSESSKTPIRTAASMLSVLLMRSMDRADSVWLAMKARGFDGDLMTARKMRWRGVDTVFLLLVAAGCMTLRFLPLTHFLGGIGLRP